MVRYVLNRVRGADNYTSALFGVDAQPDELCAFRNSRLSYCPFSRLGQTLPAVQACSKRTDLRSRYHRWANFS